MNPKVSVIISTYNRPEKLKLAIESVQRQTFQDFEIIVVHDGPTWFPAVKMDDDSKITWINLEANFGNDTKPKNTGILQSKGKYICFLDDDNQYRPEHLQVLVKALDENPDVAMVYGDRWVIDEVEGKNQLGIARDFTPALLAKHNYIDTSDALVRREALFSVGGFDERYKKYVDWNLWLRLEKYGYTFKRIPLILTDYYIHKGMKSAKTLDEKAFSVPAWSPMDCEIELQYLGFIDEPTVAIFSLVYDRESYTKECFQSLYKTAGFKFDHYVVAQTPRDAAFMKRFWKDNKAPGQTHLITNEKNVGISKGSNQAIDEIFLDNFLFAVAKNENLEVLTAKPGEIFLVNDVSAVKQISVPSRYNIVVKIDPDCFFETDGWLSKMVDIWKSNHLLAMSPFIQGLRDNPGGAARVGYGEIQNELVGWTQHLGGICVFADAKAYKDFRWDEDTFLHGAQDLEFSNHLLEKGYQPCYLENFFASHYKGTEGQEKDYPEYFLRRKKEKQTKYEV